MTAQEKCTSIQVHSRKLSGSKGGIRKYMDIVINNIKQKIADSGLKQKVVASRAGYSERNFSNMLNGRKVIRAIDIPKIALALNASPNDLFAIQNGNRSS